MTCGRFVWFLDSPNRPCEMTGVGFAGGSAQTRSELRWEFALWAGVGTVTWSALSRMPADTLKFQVFRCGIVLGRHGLSLAGGDEFRLRALGDRCVPRVEGLLREASVISPLHVSLLFRWLLGYIASCALSWCSEHAANACILLPSGTHSINTHVPKPCVTLCLFFTLLGDSSMHRRYRVLSPSACRLSKTVSHLRHRT